MHWLVGCKTCHRAELERALAVRAEPPPVAHPGTRRMRRRRAAPRGAITHLPLLGSRRALCGFKAKASSFRPTCERDAYDRAIATYRRACEKLEKASALREAEKRRKKP